MKLPQFNLPTPKTALGKLALRAVIIAVVAGLGYVLQQPEIGRGGVLYLVVKGAYDFLNGNIKNV